MFSFVYVPSKHQKQKHGLKSAVDLAKQMFFHDFQLTSIVIKIKKTIAK
jgi:hypothetical protein